MNEKKQALKDISKKIDLTVEGVENYSFEKPSVIIANHRCMKDIFVLPSALPEACKIIMSSRLMWKQNSPEKMQRRKLIEDSLYGIPIEVHGSKERLDIGLNMARVALSENWSVGIFPEGAYVPGNQVYKGRTGASRILFDSKRFDNTDANLIPVAIDYQENISNDLDYYNFNNDSVKVTICEPIDYDRYYYDYLESTNKQEIKQALRAPIDIAMKSIAKVLNLPYKDEYIEIYKRDTIVLEDGSEIKI